MNKQICKCGDGISDSARKHTQALNLSALNVPDYPRCAACLQILTSSVVRLRNSNKKFSYAQTRTSKSVNV